MANQDTPTDQASQAAAAQREARPGPGQTSLLLSIMMFLQWAIPGLSAPILAMYLSAPREQGGLGFSGQQIGWVFGLPAVVGAVAAPFIAGQVADRYLNAERAMGGLLCVGGVLQLLLASTPSFGQFLLLSLCSAIAFAPTGSLTNSISFHALDDKEKRFPRIRLWGTIGWVAASGLFGTIWLGSGDKFLNVQRISDALRVSGSLSIIFAAYCLFLLPKTPPRRSVAHPLAFARAFRLFGHRGFLVVALVAVPIAMVHTCYFMRASPYLKQDIGIPEKWIGWTMGIGQMSEIVFLAVLGLFLKRLGYRIVLTMGGLAYVLRYSIFAIGEPHWLVVAAQSLHGLCFGCFYAGAFLYVERVASADIRHSAQTVFALVLTMGPLLASFYNGYFDRFTKLGKGMTKVQDYAPFWWSMAAVALAATLALFALFPREGTESAAKGICKRCGSFRIGRYCANCGMETENA
jgi:nucleoside transporter